MTSCITMIVMLPVAIAPKTGLDAYQPLATAVVGGLFVGTILSLFVIPVMHSVMDDLIQWSSRTFWGKEVAWRQPEEE
jgi:HAE1 family hydrophobic/amphiphilic exporter-1